LTIDDGLQLELDKKMTSLGAAALPQHRLRSSVTLDLILFDCSLACEPYIGVVVMIRDKLLELCIGSSQDSLPTPTSFPLAVSPRRSPSRHAFASSLHCILQNSSFKCRFELRHQLHSVLLSSFFYRRSFATVTALLQLRHSMETLCRRSKPSCCNPSPFESLSTFFFFLINLCDIKLDDRRRASART
jgi:hypothetical protein